MDPVTFDDRSLLQQLTASFDAPAYVRRARDVERAFEDLMKRCARQRAQWLAGIRWHLHRLALSLGPAGRSQLGDEVSNRIEQIALEAAGEPGRANMPARFVSWQAILTDLRVSVARFNRRWTAFLEQLSLDDINRLREGYNRYYMLEKECAVGSERLAAMTFHRLEPLTVGELRDRFPLLPLP